MPMSRGGGIELVIDYIGDTYGGGGGGSVDDEAHDRCKGEGGEEEVEG